MTDDYPSITMRYQKARAEELERKKVRQMRPNDKKRFKRALRIVQEMLRDTVHGANVEGTKAWSQLQALDKTLDAIRVPGDEPEEGNPDAIDGNAVP